ncbi:TlpA family protein disulfide reductase [Streptomyces prasinus]|uniref:TlpA family protein disulfide reductase n=1 Tax=Streptomyces prasinus TaxID=67345 RepID=UPI0006EB389A|nr:hypothetical protein [Streptomyces prasinus]
MALYPLAVLALLVACTACALSLMVSLRVKKVLDPLIEEGAFSPGRPPTVAVGTEVPDYGQLTDIDGSPLTLGAGPDGSWILTFLSTTCSGCKAQLPSYRDYLRGQGVPRDRVISVVSGEADELGMYADEIGELSRIVHSDELPSIGTDLQVSIWPTFLVVSSDRSVQFATEDVARLPELADARPRTPVTA